MQVNTHKFTAKYDQINPIKFIGLAWPFGLLCAYRMFADVNPVRFHNFAGDQKQNTGTYSKGHQTEEKTTLNLLSLLNQQPSQGRKIGTNINQIKFK
jgi:hypothetical protein